MTDTASRPAAPLAVEQLRGGYGSIVVLHDIGFEVAAGEALGIAGPNGAGKTTLLNTIAGVLPLHAGTIRHDGVPVQDLAPHQRVARGMALVPGGRQVIGSLTVEGNLDVTVFARKQMRLDAEHHRRREEIYTLFPRVAERRFLRASSLSGGEQQMLAIARALMTAPSVMLLDEPTQGLAPRIVDEVISTLQRLKEAMTLIVVEQNTDVLDAVADRTLTISLGRIDTRRQGSKEARR